MIDDATRARARARDSLAHGRAITLFDKNTPFICHAPPPLPGVVILVHGVNSDGEWYDATETGLCAGLNTRLAREEQQLACKGIGTLRQCTYTPELNADGFVSRERDAQTFIADKPNYSPVIRFRWGYKADPEAVQDFGGGIWLNEHNYWGGGPFANGCSALPDLWSDGVNDQLFLWITAQHLNPEPGREVYACPPRHYHALAAKRLAELVRLIRQKQADVPITLVCHSQGNMIGLAAAFYGAEMGTITDANGKSAPAVADAYVLANAPYSLLKTNRTDNWSQRAWKNARGESGRVTLDARIDTLAAFVRHLAARQGSEQPAESFAHLADNATPADGSKGFTVAADRKANTCKNGRVTVYCNPHDRVISSLTVQGIGWRGLSKNEMETVDEEKKKGAPGTLFQRVWAQGHPVGVRGDYPFWDGVSPFWKPESRAAKFDFKRGVDANESAFGKMITILTGPLVAFMVAIGGLLGKTRINALPEPADWTVNADAPKLPEPHVPQAERLGQATAFDQEKDPDTGYLRPREAGSEPNPGDPYDPFRPGPSPDRDQQAGTAGEQDEARLRYEHRARLRQHDRRAGGEGTAADLKDDEAPPAWVAYSREKITTFLKDSLDQHATDHSTIMTCAANMQNVLAYDVPVGASWLSADDWNELRVAADWRLWGDLDKAHPHKVFGHYFDTGLWKGAGNEAPLHAHPDFDAVRNPAAMPGGIIDRRSNPPPRPLAEEGRS